MSIGDRVWSEKNKGRKGVWLACIGILALGPATPDGERNPAVYPLNEVAPYAVTQQVAEENARKVSENEKVRAYSFDTDQDGNLDSHVLFNYCPAPPNAKKPLLIIAQDSTSQWVAYLNPTLDDKVERFGERMEELGRSERLNIDSELRARNPRMCDKSDELRGNYELRA